LRWESLIQRNAADSDVSPEVVEASTNLLEHMRRFCTGIHCRHARLSEYFGQRLPDRLCGACDVCLNEIDGLENATVIAQKILSCVARTGERFGAEHILDVLLGADTERVRKWRHDAGTTYGLLKGTDRKALTNMLYQLVDGALLERTGGDRPILKLNDASWAVMRGQRAVQLLQPKIKVRKSRADEESWEGVDRGLFESLRKLRREIASDLGVPPFLLFSDATLRDMARVLPGSSKALLPIPRVAKRNPASLYLHF